MSAAGMVTTICVEVIEVGVGAGFEPKLTVAPATKFVPLIVNGNAAPPALALAGDSGGVIAGTGLLLVSEKFADVAPVALATTLYGPPATLFAVNVFDVATPLAFVVAVFTPPANVPLAPEAGGVNVTTTPLTGLPPLSVTVATSGAANAVLIGALCGVPLVALTFAAAPTLFVSEKFADVAPLALATTLYGPPAVELAVKVAEVATPLAFVVAVFTPPANVPLAPDAGGVNVTTTPLTGLPPLSVTVATNGAANAVLIVALWPEPLVALTFAAAPAVFVSEKFTVVRPVAAAVTVYGPPAVAFAVNGAEATPDAFVATVIVAVLLLKVPDAPDPGAVNVTFTPLTGLPPLSFTVTASALANAVLIVADCGVVPAFAVIVAGAPTVLVTEKFADVAPLALATTLYGPPAVALAVKVAEVATPLAFVVAVFTPPANVPLAPDAGGVNVTTTPLTGLLPLSVTVATNGAANAVLIVALCPEPLVAATFAAAPAVFVRTKFADVAPVALATTLYGPPAVALAVKVAEVATPLAFVVAVFTPPANVPLAPDAGGVNVTTTPLTGLLPLSVTVATSGAANAVLIAALCGVPLVAATFTGIPAVLVSEKFADVAPVALATTLYGPPATLIAVNVFDVATPLAFVVAVFTPPANVPLAPEAGGVNVTTTPLTGLPPLSVTVATSGAANAVLIGALCGVPLVALTFAAAPTLFVSEKFADVAPLALATTLYGPPAVELAVKVAEVATPLAFVVAVFTPPANVPLAPDAGGVNVTTTPLTGLPPLS